jgi:hypothetical protein
LKAQAHLYITSDPELPEGSTHVVACGTELPNCLKVFCWAADGKADQQPRNTLLFCNKCLIAMFTVGRSNLKRLYVFGLVNGQEWKRDKRTQFEFQE